MLAGAHHLLALAEVHLGGRGQDHRVGALDPFGQFAGVMGNAVFLRHLRRGVLIAADQRRYLDVGNALERIEMLLTECALTGDADFHGMTSRVSVPSWPGLSRPSRSWAEGPWNRDARVKPAHDAVVLAAAKAVDLCPCRSALELARGRLALASGFAATHAILKDDVSDRRIGRRHSVEAIDLVDLVVERTAHDEPHHHLDAFGAGLAH